MAAMRQWLRYVVENPGLSEDFIAWTFEAENAVTNAVLNAIEANDLENARTIVHERGVYTKLREKVQTEIRERKAQAKFAEESERR